MDRRSWTMLLVLGAIWGASYLLIKIALRELSPAMVAWTRIALAMAVLIPYAASRGALGGLRAHAGTLVVLALVQVAAPFLLISTGERHIASSAAGVLVASVPLFTAILAIWIDHEERSHGARLAGLVLGIVGVALLLGVDLSGSREELVGGLAVLLASVGYAIGSFVIKHRLGSMQPAGIAAAVMIPSTIALAPLAIATGPDEVPGIGPLAAVLALGVLGTGVGFALFYDLMRQVGPARATLVTYLAPGFAVVYGATLLGEAITVATVGGLVLIVGGSWLAAEGARSPRAAVRSRLRR